MAQQVLDAPICPAGQGFHWIPFSLRSRSGFCGNTTPHSASNPRGTLFDKSLSGFDADSGWLAGARP